VFRADPFPGAYANIPAPLIVLQPDPLRHHQLLKPLALDTVVPFQVQLIVDFVQWVSMPTKSSQVIRLRGQTPAGTTARG